eukprot:m.1055520 g.1055520  ORF g.1055520 m.1055520 type:complete len:476 (+) comp24192_c1_seq40:3465-4892(+)
MHRGSWCVVRLLGATVTGRGVGWSAWHVSALQCPHGDADDGGGIATDGGAVEERCRAVFGGRGVVCWVHARDNLRPPALRIRFQDRAVDKHAETKCGCPQLERHRGRQHAMRAVPHASRRALGTPPQRPRVCPVQRARGQCPVGLHGRKLPRDAARVGLAPGGTRGLIGARSDGGHRGVCQRRGRRCTGGGVGEVDHELSVRQRLRCQLHNGRLVGTREHVQPARHPRGNIAFPCEIDLNVKHRAVHRREVHRARHTHVGDGLVDEQSGAERAQFGNGVHHRNAQVGVDVPRARHRQHRVPPPLVVRGVGGALHPGKGHVSPVCGPEPFAAARLSSHVDRLCTPVWDEPRTGSGFRAFLSRHGPQPVLRVAAVQHSRAVEALRQRRTAGVAAASGCPCCPCLSREVPKVVPPRCPLALILGRPCGQNGSVVDHGFTNKHPPVGVRCVVLFPRGSGARETSGVRLRACSWRDDAHW